MHIAGLIFLWANRLYSAAMIIYGARVLSRNDSGPMRRTAVNITLIAVWQLVGTYLLVDVRGMNPFNLLWWYPAGWLVLTIARAIGTEIRRLSLRSDN
jgi:hypothetical protein